MKYDFKCTKCGRIYELDMSIKEYEDVSKHLVCDDCHITLKRTYQKLATFVMDKKEETE